MRTAFWEGKNIRDLLREKWLLCSVSGKCFVELCHMRKCFLCFPFENRMFSIRETYVSQGGNIRFPCGEHRNFKSKWVFMLRRFWVYIKGEKRRLARNKKSYWEPVVFIFRLAWRNWLETGLLFADAVIASFWISNIWSSKRYRSLIFCHF